MYKISFYVPEENLEPVKAALFAAGAGRIGNYDQCCWQTKGQGQFRPLAGSNPHLGNQQQLSTLEEYLVEMVCADELIHEVIRALKQAHPYEEPAYCAFEVNSF